MKISAVILTKDEEKNIQRAIKSVAFCDEILVVDDYSTDQTVKIAKKLGAVVFKRQLNGDFAKQRNFGLKKSGGQWILFVDADEEVTYDLSQQIKKLISSQSEHKAYYIKRRDFWWGTDLKYGETKKVRTKGLIRLIKKDSGYWTNPVHEVFTTSSSVGRLTSYLNHFPHPTLKEFLKEVNFYSTLRAKHLTGDKKSNIWEVIVYPSGKFLQNYFLKSGFRDGPAGFAYALIMSFHSFLVRAKLYQYKKID